MRKRVTIGIDEVGRGALAGPVVLAAVALSGRISWQHPRLGRIRDSKKLTPKRREAWFRYLAAHPAFAWRVARVGPTVIDRINITRAANLAAYRLVRRTAPDGNAFAWLDGGLALPPHIPHRALIKGDEHKPLIAAASIIAKVWRDRHMARLANSLPAYGFEIHKGYGTYRHRRMLRRHGLSAVHRWSFCHRLV
ncbi:MAG: ribonuclease HII [bacterium]|nr:ribonuclease HII [bacterium]